MKRRPPAPWRPERQMTATEKRNWALLMSPLTAPVTPAPKPRASKRGRASNYAKGMSAERKAKDMLRAEGYVFEVNLGSRGTADILARRGSADVVGPVYRAVQVKSTATFRPGFLNDGLARFLGIGKHAGRSAFLAPDGTREVWGFLREQGRMSLVAVVVLDTDGGMTVTGEKAQEVETSLKKMLAKASQPAKPNRSLKQRLGIKE